MNQRYLSQQIGEDLNRKMVFVGGPRQVGKTTLAKTFLNDPRGYLNWDFAPHREAILKHELPMAPLWIFDEIHKYKSWRNYLKGLFDQYHESHTILVTGSARLDYYRYSGDSLQGRYHYLRLHPLSVAELGGDSVQCLSDLLRLGGFPEPFFSGSERNSKRWSRDYRNCLIQEDLPQLESVHDLGNLELLALRLPDLVGSPLSINALREDLNVSHKAVATWIQILERLYAIFRISPFGPPKIRAVKKEQKHYQFDWTLVTDLSLRFENLVACALIKWVHFLQDTEGDSIDLSYFRDVEGREVDFVVLRDKTPILMIECKWNDAPVSKSLVYLKKRYPECPAYQLSAVGTKNILTELGIRVCPGDIFLKTLI